MSEIPLMKLELIGGPDYFRKARLDKTANFLENAIEEAIKLRQRDQFLKKLNEANAVFQGEYGSSTKRKERFGQEIELLSKAEQQDYRKFGRAWRGVAFQEVLVDLPFHKVDLLLVTYANEIENFYISETKDSIAGRPLVLGLVIPEIRFLRLCLCYLFLCEGWFDEFAKFHYRLCRIVNSSLDSSTDLKGYVSVIARTGYSALVDGYSSVIRNAIAHAHIKMERNAFIFTDPQNPKETPISLDYETFKTQHYDTLMGNIELWQLFTVLRTLRRTAVEELK